MAYLVFFGLPAALLILGFPIFLILLVTSIVAVLTVADVPTEAIQTSMFGSLDNFPLLMPQRMVPLGYSLMGLLVAMRLLTRSRRGSPSRAEASQ